MFRSTASLATLAVALFATESCATVRVASPPSPRSPAPMKPAGETTALVTDEDKTLYALGKILGKKLGEFYLTPHEFEIVKAGLAEDALRHRPERVDLDVYGEKVNEFRVVRWKQVDVAERARGDVYRAAVAKEPGAETLPSGVIIKIERTGEGESPDATSDVTVNYEGRLADGTVFDSSRKRGKPATFQLAHTIGCWRDGVARMRVGGKAHLVCPPDQAYRERGSPPAIPPGATLIFDVELVSVGPHEAAPEPSESPN